MTEYAVEVYEDLRGEWRWRASSKNGRIVADSGEGYISQAHCVAMVERLFAGAENVTLSFATG